MTPVMQFSPNAQVVNETSVGGSTNEFLAYSQTRRRGLRTADVQARFQAAVEAGNVWSVCNQVGITSQAGLSATTPALTIANPAGSGKRGILWKATAFMAVVNVAAAAVWLAANTNVAAAAVTGTLTTAHRNLKMGGSGSPSQLQFFLAATLPAAPVGIDLMGIGLTGAITVQCGAVQYGGWYDGSIIIEPGTAISIQTSTASGASGLWCSYIVEEQPYYNA